MVEGRYRLRTLTYSGRNQAEFLAETAELQTRGEKLTVTLISAAQDDIDLVRSQAADREPARTSEPGPDPERGRSRRWKAG